MSAIQQSRGIMAALSVLQGGTATGSILVHSTAATGSVPAHAHLVPIVGGALQEDAIVRVDKNPATEGGAWPVVLAGTSVTVSAVQGGTRGNLAAGTELLWDPPLSGIATKSATVAGLSGGTWLDTFGSLKDLRQFRGLSPDVAQDLLRAQAGMMPAAVLAWASCGPVSGSVSAAYGATQDRAGRGVRLWKNHWDLFLVTSRQSDLAIRLREGDQLRDDVLEVLTDRVAVRGQVLSSPQGIEILDARQYASTPTSFVDVVQFTTSYALVKRDAQAFSDWLVTRYRSFYEKGTHPAELDVPDVKVPMT